MGIVLSNATLVDIDPVQVAPGELRIENGLIAARERQITPRAEDEIWDCHGAVVLPGMVNGHTHLYSALAAGMPPPPHAPRNFMEILELVWWRLDQALDVESICMSTRIGGLEALRSGTTTLIDHHASPNCVAGVLDLVETELSGLGIRGVLCYETSDRHGPENRDAGLEENRRYLDKHRYQRSNQFAALVGAHASFTLEDQTLNELARLAEQYSSGVHIHVAEDACDEDNCHQEHQVALIDRLAGHGLIKPRSVFAHGVHLDADSVLRVNNAGLTLAHNPRSNMNNGVGYGPMGHYTCPVMLGTDGIGADMFAEAKQAWFISRDFHAGLEPEQILAMLAQAARRASDSLDITLGKLEPGAAADIVVTDYCPATPLTTENFAGHFLFALGSQHVKDVIVQGHWGMRNREIVVADEQRWRAEAATVAAELWRRMDGY